MSDFDFDSVPMHYIPGEAMATHIINVMHLVLPEGERAMAQALAEALPLISDERLAEEVRGFIGQESMHAGSHERPPAPREIGLDVGPMVELMSWLIDRLLGDHGLTGRAKQAWLCERLGLFAGMEHYTAVIGEWLLTTTDSKRRACIRRCSTWSAGTAPRRSNTAASSTTPTCTSTAATPAGAQARIASEDCSRCSWPPAATCSTGPRATRAAGGRCSW